MTLQSWLGFSTSLKMVPFASLGTVFYSPFIVTMTFSVVSFSRQSEILVENRDVGLFILLHSTPPLGGSLQNIAILFGTKKMVWPTVKKFGDTYMRYMPLCGVCLSVWPSVIFVDSAETNKISRIQYKLCVIAFKCQHSLAPPYLSDQLNKSLESSPDSVWDHRVRQRSSYQLLEGRH